VNELLQYSYSEKAHQYLLVQYKNYPVLFTNQISTLLGLDNTKNIVQNFNRNKHFFIENVDYFYLSGEELSSFKDYVKSIHGSVDVPPELQEPTNLFKRLVLNNALRTSDLYLWTETGVLNHIKLADTSEAKDLFLIVRDAYLELKYSKQNQNLISMNNIEEYFNSKFDLIVSNNNSKFEDLNNKLDSLSSNFDLKVQNKFEEVFTFFNNKFDLIYNGCRWIYNAIKSPIVTKEHTVTNKTITSTPQVDSEFPRRTIPDIEIEKLNRSLKTKNICLPFRYIYDSDNFEQILSDEKLISVEEYVELYVPKSPKKTRVFRDYILHFLVSCGVLDKLTLKPFSNYDPYFKYFVLVKFNSKSYTKTQTRIYLTEMGIEIVNKFLVENDHHIKTT